MTRPVLVIPDLHGRADLLDAAVRAFPEHHYLSLGDAIDRGPDSLGTVERLMELHGQGRATLLMGNHERMMQEGPRAYARHLGSHDMGDYRRAMEGLKWWTNAGGETVRREWTARGHGSLTLEQFPKLLSDYLALLTRVAYVTQDGQIHAEVPAEPSVLVSHAAPPVAHRQYPEPLSAALWLRPYEGPFTLPPGVVYSVHGHTPLRHPLRLGRHVYLDLGAYETGLLALLPLQVQTLSEVTVLMGRGTPSRTEKYPMIGERVSSRPLLVSDVLRS